MSASFLATAQRRALHALTVTAADLRTELAAALTDIAARTEASERCIILSGGVDTCAILAAAKEQGVTFTAALTVLTGESSPDKDFATAAAAEHGLTHHVIQVQSSDLIEEYLPACAKLLATFDGMTLRNSLVVAAAFSKAAQLGFKHAVVGDGADELFGGYSFMWGMADNPDEWRSKRDKMCAQWTFATAQLAASHGLTSHSPYTEPRFVAWAIANTCRTDCIATRPIRLTLGGEAIQHATGKLCLREAYQTISSWRRKDPIEVGSGITIIGHDEYWSDLISDEEFSKAKADRIARGFVLNNKEHLANFRAFEKAFGIDGVGHPTKKRLGLGNRMGCTRPVRLRGSLVFRKRRHFSSLTPRLRLHGYPLDGISSPRL